MTIANFVSSLRPRDGKSMRHLAREAYQMYVDRMGREPAPMTSDYEAIAASGDALLAWRGNDLVGMLVIRPAESMMLVENIAVAPVMQGSGLGSELLIKAERIARETGRYEVCLYTNATMVENLAFYTHRGYVETHRIVEEGYNRVYFTKQV
ncbi:MAG: GNAT family N-acetyltransferase [Leifsonia sp.]